MEKSEEFWLWPEGKVEYYKINENLAFKYYMQQTGLYNYVQTCIEIVRKSYTYLEPSVDNQPAYSVVRGK